MKKAGNTETFDFSLVITGVSQLTAEVQDALFNAGCDDATLSIQARHLYADFSRAASSMKEAVRSAIRDVRQARIGAEVLANI